MGCYVCGTRQSDPARGASPWQRGVVNGVQVLGCPDCQRSGEWARALDTCGGCGSTALVRRLGETICRSCGFAGDSVPAAGGAAGAPGEQAALTDEVARALDRVFGRD